MVGRRALCLAGLLIAAVPSVAGAHGRVAVGEVRDPAGDLSLDVGDVMPDPPVNFTRVTVRYDQPAATVESTFRLSGPVASTSELSISVALGFLEPGGSCTLPEFTSRRWHSEQEGNAVVGASPTSTTPPRVSSSVFQGGVFSGVTGDAIAVHGRKVRFESANPAMRAFRYDCAEAALVVRSAAGGGIGVDLSAPFPLVARPATTR